MYSGSKDRSTCSIEHLNNFSNSPKLLRQGIHNDEQ